MRGLVTTSLISGFPGTGKTYLLENSEKDLLDSDSSRFDKSRFPENYIKHIKKNIGAVDAILISSHKEVRGALVDEGLPYFLVYPEISLRKEYLERYKNRGSSEKFIQLIGENWSDWIKELREQQGCKHVVLTEGQYISDVFSELH